MCKVSMVYSIQALFNKSFRLDNLFTLLVLVRPKTIPFKRLSFKHFFQADKASMRSLRSHAGYDVTFTLLNPQPDILRVKWAIKDAVNGRRTSQK